MKIEFCVKGLSLSAEVAVEPYVPAKTWGRPENCHPAEGGEIEFETLECNGKDAMFLLQSNFRDEIEMAALDVADKQAKADHAEALIDAYCF